MKLLLIDTNIFVCFFEQGFYSTNTTFKKPEETTILKKLLKKLDDNKINLILPEVIIIETERIKNEKLTELDNLYKATYVKVQETNLQGRILALNAQEKIKKSLDDIGKEEKNNIEEVWNIFKEISEHGNTEIIKLNEDILVESYKRAISGRKPYNKKNPNNTQPDCLIIESVKSYLKTKQLTDYEMYLCTHDDDFYTDEKKTKLSDDITSELKIKGFSTNLLEIMEKLRLIKKTKKTKPKVEKQIVYPSIPQEIINIEKTDVQGINNDQS
jgi:hypothetical protein